MENYFKLGLILLILLAGCKKECQYSNLSAVSCGAGYDLVHGATYSTTGHANDYLTDLLFVINDDSSYKATFSSYPDSMPLGSIDFSSKTLLGANILTASQGNDVKSQGFLCKQPNANNWKYTVKYTLKDQCKGSKITRILFTASLLCDKIPADANITLATVNINPY